MIEGGEDTDSQRSRLEVYGLDAVASSPKKYCLHFTHPEAESSSAIGTMAHGQVAEHL